MQLIFWSMHGIISDWSATHMSGTVDRPLDLYAESAWTKRRRRATATKAHQNKIKGELKATVFEAVCCLFVCVKQKRVKQV